MATMIPPQYDAKTRSNAEKRIFDLLKNDPDTESWIALHSLGLSARADKPYGEIDFVVIIPGGGIICLEIKGGGISCANGIWATTDKHGQVHTMTRSPFMQAREGMFALREAMEFHFGSNHNVMKCTIGYIVVFPDVDAPPQTTEFAPWEVIDRTALQRPVSQLIRRAIRDQRRKLDFRVDSSLPSPELAREVRQLLRPDFDIVIARSTQILKTEEKLIRLTENQYDVLDRLQENPRCLIKGAAGTGKTLLGLEYAKRAAKKGARVLLTCFNKLLGDWLREQTQGYEGITAGSYYRCLREIILATPFADEFIQQEQKATDDTLFSEVFPFYGELSASEIEDQFDILVLDEAQDLVRPTILNVLNAHLRGGMAGGNWVVLGDFTNQAIYASGGEDHLVLLDRYCPYYTREHLTINCRNTRQISEETILLSGFSTPPFRLSAVNGLSVDYRYWYNERQQIKKLDSVLRCHLKDGIDPKDILVLSPVSFDRSVASALQSTDQYTLHDVKHKLFRKGKEHQIFFSTIHAFKGMESPVIVLCDVGEIETEEPQALLYVGMSRARSHLTILIHEGTQPALAQLTTRKLKETWET